MPEKIMCGAEKFSMHYAPLTHPPISGLVSGGHMATTDTWGLRFRGSELASAHVLSLPTIDVQGLMSRVSLPYKKVQSSRVSLRYKSLVRVNVELSTN